MRRLHLARRRSSGVCPFWIDRMKIKWGTWRKSSPFNMGNSNNSTHMESTEYFSPFVTKFLRRGFTMRAKFCLDWQKIFSPLHARRIIRTPHQRPPRRNLCGEGSPFETTDKTFAFPAFAPQALFVKLFFGDGKTGAGKAREAYDKSIQKGRAGGGFHDRLYAVLHDPASR